ncbi:unnamed protein product [Onchocerca flexuosa]|uniref:Transposase n=1 Tax=Onchocerca flexuosa TaxID=387005 RepID=A0A183GY73_9BILA|nr:unnamed protein product [Onchocerca flexuosa]
MNGVSLHITLSFAREANGPKPRRFAIDDNLLCGDDTAYRNDFITVKIFRFNPSIFRYNLSHSRGSATSNRDQ